jgi:hypothetical protein
VPNATSASSDAADTTGEATVGAAGCRAHGGVGCALASRLAGEPLLGTAPERSRSWLLIEHQGPWPARGLPDDLPAPVRSRIEAAQGSGLRPQLIRRPGRRRHVGPGSVFLVGPRPDAPACSADAVAPAARQVVEHRVIDDYRQLADIDLTALVSGGRPGWGAPYGDRLLLVCAHGRRDACCAQFGGPVARRLAAKFGDVVWETTHLGGDRFAANLACLPDGVYHGRLTLDGASDVAAACLRGEISPEFYRGRAGVPAAAQTAEAGISA